MERRKAFQEEAASSMVREPWMLSGWRELLVLRESDVGGVVESEWVVRQGRWGVKKPLIKWRKVEKTRFEVNIHRWVQM